MDFHFFLLGVNLGFLGTLCVRERGQVVYVEDVPHFSFFFSFLHQRERERKRSMFWCGREREVS